MELVPNRVCEAHSNFLRLDQLLIKIAENTYVENAPSFLFSARWGRKGRDGYSTCANYS